ncbi:hypothetical protein RQP46_004115 [Phenoliferia psychrophenolica]
MFFSASGWEFAKPVASAAGGTTEIYRQVSEQLGFSVFIPLAVGETLQYIWPVQVKWVLSWIGKAGGLSTYSSAFYHGAFQALSGEAVAFVFLTNILIFLTFNILLFVVARYIKPGRWIGRTESTELFDPPTTIALLFCGTAKGIALGGP